jgi:hypothetical protein
MKTKQEFEKELESERIGLFTELLQSDLPDASVKVIKAVRTERSGKAYHMLTVSIDKKLYLEKNLSYLLALRSIVKEYRSGVNAKALAEISALAKSINAAAIAAKLPTFAATETAKYFDLDKAIAKWQAGVVAIEAAEQPSEQVNDGLFEQLASAMNPAAYYPAVSLLAEGGSHV